jgi:uncharacterized protein YcfL
MKKVILASLIAMILVGCSSKDEESKSDQNAIEPPQAVESSNTQQQLTTSDQQLTEMYNKIHQGIYTLKNAQDPNLNEILDKIEAYGADNRLDLNESQEILSMIQLHAQELSKTITPKGNEAAATQQESQSDSILENPNPFQE